MLDITKPLAGCRILVVEDEYLIADMMQEWLSEAGADVLGPVSNLKRALEVVESAHRGLDVAVLDINLGRGETAYPVADRLDELGIPYLFATGDVRIIGDAAHRERPRLNKPVARLDLLKALAKLLPGAGAS